jgi:hypothetical protein
MTLLCFLTIVNVASASTPKNEEVLKNVDVQLLQTTLSIETNPVQNDGPTTQAGGVAMGNQSEEGIHVEAGEVASSDGAFTSDDGNLQRTAVSKGDVAPFAGTFWPQLANDDLAANLMERRVRLASASDSVTMDQAAVGKTAGKICPHQTTEDACISGHESRGGYRNSECAWSCGDRIKHCPVCEKQFCEPSYIGFSARVSVDGMNTFTHNGCPHRRRRGYEGDIGPR